jgi:hypothetical protein
MGERDGAFFSTFVHYTEYGLWVRFASMTGVGITPEINDHALNYLGWELSISIQRVLASLFISL